LNDFLYRPKDSSGSSSSSASQSLQAAAGPPASEHADIDAELELKLLQDELFGKVKFADISFVVHG
jgi:hypothetical protein